MGRVVKYVMAAGASEGLEIRSLHDGAIRTTLAYECRSAALTFMSGVAAGWDKLDLVTWLVGPYGRTTRHGVDASRARNASHPHRDRAPLDGAAIEALLIRVRVQVLASLEKAALDVGALEFTDDLVARGLVRKVKGGDGHEAWIPVDAERALLRDRVRSLFTAHYLNAPDTYAELFVCHRCEAVVFDAHAKALGICGAHRMSGVMPCESEAPATAGRVSSRG